VKKPVTGSVNRSMPGRKAPQTEGLSYHDPDAVTLNMSQIFDGFL